MSTKDQRIKDFLIQKRAPLDEWNIHEQLCLASAVACSGDQNWMSVSRSLKGIVNAYSARPADWFHAKGCATQYGKLLESVETPKRKKRTASERENVETPSTPVESLVKKLTEERIAELKKLIYEEQQQYAKLKDEIIFLSSPSMDEVKIRELWSQIEQEKVQEERDKEKHDQWVKEREEKKQELERQWRTQKTPLKVQKSVSQEEPTEPDTTTTTQPSTPIQTASTSAPTLVTLLDKKSSLMDISTSEKSQLMAVMPDATATGGKDDIKDEEAELLADFSELIDEKFDIDEELEVLNSIIMNPEILDDKISDGDHPNKDADDSSQATSTDDYDKLKIKQIAETIQDFAVNVDGSNAIPIEAPKIEENIQESSTPTSVEMIEAPMESNDSNITKEEPVDEVSEKIVISDESSNTTDKKEEMDTNDGESSVAEEPKKR